MRRRWRMGLAVVSLVAAGALLALELGRGQSVAADTKPAVTKGTPRLVDLGAKACIPCKLMAPVLEGLKKDFAGRLEVEFIDVWMKENVPLAEKYRIRVIPTQILLDASGKELWRHEGYISRYGLLDKWRELGYPFAEQALAATLRRMEPAQADSPPGGQGCFLCDGPIDAKAAVVVKADDTEVRLCGPHHYFVMHSCYTGKKENLEADVTVTDWSTGKPVRARDAVYVYGVESETGRPTVKAFAGREPADKEQKASGGSTVGWDALKQKELAVRCGFCDRAVYPSDAAAVKVGQVRTWGCCSHCAMGVVARLGKDIQVRQRDRLTGQEIVVQTLSGYVAAVEPATAVAWFGLKKKADGKFASAGCFHQGFFASERNLKEWLKRNPTAVGSMISIDQVLADKMKLTPKQIAGACKLGSCSGG